MREKKGEALCVCSPSQRARANREGDGRHKGSQNKGKVRKKRGNPAVSKSTKGVFSVASASVVSFLRSALLCQLNAVLCFDGQVGWKERKASEGRRVGEFFFNSVFFLLRKDAPAFFSFGRTPRAFCSQTVPPSAIRTSHLLPNPTQICVPARVQENQEVQQTARPLVLWYVSPLSSRVCEGCASPPPQPAVPSVSSAWPFSG